MPFWTKRPANNQEFIAAERKKHDEKIKRFLAEYERKKQAQEEQPKKEESKAEDSDGPTTKEKIVTGVKRAGVIVKKIYEYEPSEETKRSVRKSFRYAKSEVRDLGNLAPRSRERFRSSDDDEISWDDYFGSGDSISGYAESFSPPSLRMTWSGQPTAHRYESDKYDPAAEMGLGFTNPLEGYWISDVAAGSRKRHRNIDIENPLSGYDKIFSNLANRAHRSKRNKRR
jgi:hypothetical protein